jgi:hypothetical protein
VTSWMRTFYRVNIFHARAVPCEYGAWSIREDSKGCVIRERAPGWAVEVRVDLPKPWHTLDVYVPLESSAWKEVMEKTAEEIREAGHIWAELRFQGVRDDIYVSFPDLLSWREPGPAFGYVWERHWHEALEAFEKVSVDHSLCEGIWGLQPPIRRQKGVMVP